MDTWKSIKLDPIRTINSKKNIEISHENEVMNLLISKASDAEVVQVRNSKDHVSKLDNSPQYETIKSRHNSQQCCSCETYKNLMTCAHVIAVAQHVGDRSYSSINLTLKPKLKNILDKYGGRKRNETSRKRRGKQKDRNQSKESIFRNKSENRYSSITVKIFAKCKDLVKIQLSQLRTNYTLLI